MIQHKRDSTVVESAQSVILLRLKISKRPTLRIRRRRRA